MAPALMMQTATGLLAVSAAGGLITAAIRHRNLRIPAVDCCHMDGVTRVIRRNEKLE